MEDGEIAAEGIQGGDHLGSQIRIRSMRIYFGNQCFETLQVGRVEDLAHTISCSGKGKRGKTEYLEKFLDCFISKVCRSEGI